MENYVCTNCGRTEPSAGSCPDCGADMIAQSMLGGEETGLGRADTAGDDAESLEDLRDGELEDEEEEEGDDDEL